jgi:hypothetical protein
MPECKFCHGGIEWRNIEGKYVPYNLDGTLHRCKAPAADAKKDETTAIGEFEGVTRGQLGIKRKDGSIYMVTGTRDLLAYLATPDCTAKKGMSITVSVVKGIATGIGPGPGPAPAGGIEKIVADTKTNAQKQTDCTSPAAAPVPAKKAPFDRDLITSMIGNPDTYWRAKFMLDLQAHDEIRQQVEWKNWGECIDLAMKYHQVADVPLEEGTGISVFATATIIHDFIRGKVEVPAGGAP